MKRIIKSFGKSLSKVQKKALPYKVYLLSIFALSLGYLTFLDTGIRDLYYFSFVIAWLFLIILFKLKSTHTIIVCFFLLLIMLLAYITNNQIMLIESAVFLYLFFAIVLLQEGKELLL